MKVGDGRATWLTLPLVLVVCPIVILAVSVPFLQEPPGVAFGGRSLLFAAEFLMLTPVFLFGVALGAWRTLRPRRVPPLIHPSGDGSPWGRTAGGDARRFEPPPWESETPSALAARPAQDRTVQKST